MPLTTPIIIGATSFFTKKKYLHSSMWLSPHATFIRWLFLRAKYLIPKLVFPKWLILLDLNSNSWLREATHLQYGHNLKLFEFLQKSRGSNMWRGSYRIVRSSIYTENIVSSLSELQIKFNIYLRDFHHQRVWFFKMYSVHDRIW